MVQFFRTARIAAALSLLFILVTAGMADTLRLKDGSIIKGRIVNFVVG